MGQNPTHLTGTNSTAPAVLSLVLFLLIVCQLTINTMPPKKKSKTTSHVNLSTPAASISPDAGYSQDADSVPGAVNAAKVVLHRKKRSRFTRELDQSSPSPDVKLTKKDRTFVPNSPPRALIRQVRRTGSSPSCIIFGQIREFLYPDYFFCSPCKLYENEVSAAGNKPIRVQRNSRRFRCQAKHKEFSFPTHRKFSECCTESTTNLIRYLNTNKRSDSLETNVEAVTESDSLENNVKVFAERDLLERNEEIFARNDDNDELRASLETKNMEMDQLYTDFSSLALALHGSEELFSERVEEVSNRFQAIINDLKNDIVDLKRQLNVAKTHLNYYRNKAEEDKEQQRHSHPSTTLDVAIIRSVNELLESNQHVDRIINPCFTLFVLSGTLSSHPKKSSVS